MQKSTGSVMKPVDVNSCVLGWLNLGIKHVFLLFLYNSTNCNSYSTSLFPGRSNRPLTRAASDSGDQGTSPGRSHLNSLGQFDNTGSTCFVYIFCKYVL